MRTDTVGDRIKKIRLTLGIKQRELADKLGISSNFLSELEHNKRAPSKTLVLLLEYRYSINKEWLLDNKGEMVAREEPSKREERQEIPFDLKCMANAIKFAFNLQKAAENVSDHEFTATQMVYSVFSVYAGFLYADGLIRNEENLMEKLKPEIEKHLKVSYSKSEDGALAAKYPDGLTITTKKL